MTFNNASRLAVLLLTLAFGVGVQAQFNSPLEKFDVPVYPKSGVYFDPTQGGTGLTVERLPIGAQTFVFTTYYHYEANGEPTWMNFGDFLAQNSFADYGATGLPATIRSQWNYSTGGACFDCPFSTINTTYPPYGERVLNVRNGELLQMPATGNAPIRNMRLGSKIPANGSSALTLLTNGAVWSVTRVRFGTPDAGDSEYTLNGWLIIKPRPTAEKLTFTNNSRGIVEPAWLQVADKNTPSQFEFHKVFNSTANLSTDLRALLGTNLFSYAEYPEAPDADVGTLIADAQTDQIRMYRRCSVPNQTTECPFGSIRSNVTINAIADVQDAGKTSEGDDRLVIRVYNFDRVASPPMWLSEYELTRVPDLIARTLAPNLPSGYAGKP